MVYIYIFVCKQWYFFSRNNCFILTFCLIDELYLCNVKLTSGTTSSLTELGVQAHTAPKKPNHATYEGRLLTFCGWPENLKQTPEMLAEAGFYYTGEDSILYQRLF